MQWGIQPTKECKTQIFERRLFYNIDVDLSVKNKIKPKCLLYSYSALIRNQNINQH